MRSSKLQLIVFALSFLGMASAVFAQATVQPPQDQRRNFVDGLLRNLIDSEMSLRGSAPLVPVPPAQATQKMRQARQALDAFRRAGNQLISSLRNEARYSPEARLVLGDALGVMSAADVLVQRSQAFQDVSAISNDIADLDRQWRVLAHRLRQTPNIARSVIRQVDAMDSHNQQLAGLLQLDPQVDRQELGHFFATLAADFDHLQEDIHIDLANLPQQRQFESEIRQLAAWVYQIRNSVSANRPYREIQSQYKRYHDTWMPIKARLRRVENRHIQRNVSRITEVNERLHELLWMPKVIDGHDVLYMANTLKSNVDEICDNISLKKLIALPNAQDVFERAKEFYTLCGDFRDSVVTKTKLEELLWDFRVLEVAWDDLHGVLGRVEDPDTLRQIAIIDASLDELRGSLGVGSTVNQREATELASSLSNMTDLLHYDMSRFVGRSSQYDGRFRTAAVQATDQFRRSAKTLHDDVSNNAGDAKVRQQSQTIYDQWNDLQDYVAQVSASDRTEIVRTSQQIAPLVAKLQVLYSY